MSGGLADGLQAAWSLVAGLDARLAEVVWLSLAVSASGLLWPAP